MEPNRLDAKDGIAWLSPEQAALAALPFLLFGFANVALQFDAFHFSPGRASYVAMLVTHPYLVFNWVILAGLVVGIINGFPRWTFAYLGWALLNLLWWGNATFYGQPVNWACLPFLAALMIALLIRRRKGLPLFPGGVWRDLTLLPFGLYLFFAALYISFDENHHPALLFFMVAAGLAAAGGAWGYFRAASPLRRALALTGGLVVLAALEMWNALTWEAAAYYGLPPSPPFQKVAVGVAWIASMAGLLLGIGGLAEWLWRRKPAGG